MVFSSREIAIDRYVIDDPKQNSIRCSHFSECNWYKDGNNVGLNVNNWEVPFGHSSQHCKSQISWLLNEILISLLQRSIDLIWVTVSIWGTWLTVLGSIWGKRSNKTSSWNCTNNITCVWISELSCIMAAASDAEGPEGEAEWQWNGEQLPWDGSFLFPEHIQRSDGRKTQG